MTDMTEIPPLRDPQTGFGMTDSKCDTVIAFIGLGAMGYPMAGHLAAAGYALRVHNRTASKAVRFLSEYEGGTHHHAKTPDAAAHNADWLVVCVGHDDDLRTVTLGPNGAIAALKPGSCLINHGTSSVDISHELAAACAARAVDFLDAPLSGGQNGAEQGCLTIFIGGAEKTLLKARPIFECYARQVTHMGDIGCGQTTKMINQICVAGLLQGLSEGLAFAKKSGINRDAVLKAIGQGAAQSWQMDHRGSTMVQGRFDFGFAVEWMHKDLRICLDEAERIGAALPISRIIHQYYAELMDQGDHRLDSSALIKRLL